MADSQKPGREVGRQGSDTVQLGWFRRLECHRVGTLCSFGSGLRKDSPLHDEGTRPTLRTIPHAAGRKLPSKKKGPPFRIRTVDTPNVNARLWVLVETTPR
jgi:hypothetical protein